MDFTSDTNSPTHVTLVILLNVDRRLVEIVYITMRRWRPTRCGK